MEVKHKDRVTCKINDVKITDAMICVRDTRYFICQNHCDGNYSGDRLGYKYSWQFHPEEDGNSGVTKLKVLKVVTPARATLRDVINSVVRDLS